MDSLLSFSFFHFFASSIGSFFLIHTPYHLFYFRFNRQDLGTKMSRFNNQNNNQYPPQGSHGGGSPMQHHQQPYQHPAPTPTSPRMNYNNPDRSYPPQQPIGYQPGGPGGYDHTAGHHGYDMIDESDNAGLMSNQGRAGGRNNGYNKGPMPRSASRLDRAATMNRRVNNK